MEALLYGAVIAAWLSGFMFCRFTHRQRGIEHDDWDVVIPPGPLVGADK